MSRILLLGSGGREHALAWKLAQSPRVEHLFVAPGNAGTACEARCTNLGVAVTDFPALIRFAREQGVDFVVIGPEDPLAMGAVDAFAAAGIPAFGPTAAAARIEASKAFARNFMARHGIPSPRYRTFTDYDEALAFLRQAAFPVVIKASGLAGGKGVIVPDDPNEAVAALRAMLVEGRFGSAGHEVVIEERLEGREVSVLAFCDGERLALMPVAQDHKRVYDGDQGPNTGGMGAFAPALLDEALLETITVTILQPTLAGLAAAGTPYRGVLYAGLMLTAAGPKVLEFNCRFGDPETQVILPLLAGDLFTILHDCAHGCLRPETVRWYPAAALCVVAAAAGYPGAYDRGDVIAGLETAEAQIGVKVFHAGPTLDAAGRVCTAGGRVLAITAWGDDLTQARTRAYQAISAIAFRGMHYRRDIGTRSSL
jgi:phosphoribosylamine--glycine ligase